MPIIAVRTVPGRTRGQGRDQVPTLVRMEVRSAKSEAIRPIGKPSSPIAWGVRESVPAPSPLGSGTAFTTEDAGDTEDAFKAFPCVPSMLCGSISSVLPYPRQGRSVRRLDLLRQRRRV